MRDPQLVRIKSALIIKWWKHLQGRETDDGALEIWVSLLSGSEKGFFLEKGSFQKSPFSRDSREYRDLEILESPQIGKQRRIWPLSKDSWEFRDFGDSRDSLGWKTPFVMDPFSGPDIRDVTSRMSFTAYLEVFEKRNLCMGSVSTTSRNSRGVRFDSGRPACKFNTHGVPTNSKT